MSVDHSVVTAFGPVQVALTEADHCYVSSSSFNYRDQDYELGIHLYRNADGDWSTTPPSPDYGGRPYVRRRVPGQWSNKEAPPSYLKKILDEVIGKVTPTLTLERRRKAEKEHADSQLRILAEKLKEAEDHVRELSEQQTKLLTKTSARLATLC
jgi:hypothetical protein